MPAASHSSLRVSLAELSRTGAMMARGEPSPLASLEHPRLGDIAECLFFSPGDGRIWLNDQRMVLLHGGALGSLRRELIDSLGMERARGLLTRAGYESGARDARLVRERWPEGALTAQFMAGLQLHALEGMVKVEPVEFRIDVQAGSYLGEFLWHHSCEADEHIAAYGIGTEPSCWMQLGYAMGYVTSLMGKTVVFREVACRAMGAEVCRVVGRNAEAWDDVAGDLDPLRAQSFVGARAFDQSPRLFAMPDEPAAPVPPAPGALPGQEEMVGVSPAFKSACHQLSRVAPTSAAVLLTGESGVGKELFAAMLHRISTRKDKPFVALNCAAIPENLIEAELFGVERGAYTGAVATRAGRFERADGGTLFLDEIGTLGLVGQGKLLRALQQGEIERLGGHRVLRVDVRVVAATNADLQAEVRAGRFREDLYYRLAVFPIHLPPLRERREDIPLLMNYFRRLYGQRHGRQTPGFAMRAVKALLAYDFPGNIRELQNLVERGVISIEDGQPIDLPHMLRQETLHAERLYSLQGQEPGRLVRNDTADHPAPADGGDTLVQALLAGTESLEIQALEQRILRQAVQACGGNLSAAARRVGLTRAQLAYRLGPRAPSEPAP
ncbi:MAG: sigma-54-dependent Fis family transcriptional regulator [Comamonas sp.]